MVAFISYMIVFLILILFALKLSVKHFVGYTILFWPVFLMYGFLSPSPVRHVLFSMYYTVTIIFTGVFLITYLIGRVLVSRIYQYPILRIPKDLSDYVLRASLILSYFVFWTWILIVDGFNIQNVLIFCSVIALIALLYMFIWTIWKVVKFISISIFWGIFRGLTPPKKQSRHLVHQERNNNDFEQEHEGWYDSQPQYQEQRTYDEDLAPVETRAIRTRKNGKDITHIVVRIDNNEF